MPSISRAIEAMDTACRAWSLGYDQGDRWDIRDGGECDCSSLVIWALRQGGFDTGAASYTGDLSANLTARGWRRLPPDLSTLRPGDVLLNDAYHVCMVVAGSGRSATVAQASIDERGRATGGRSGDQDGHETNERTAYVYAHGGWDCILRYEGATSGSSRVIRVDGYWGSDTNGLLQHVLGTHEDRVISGQPVSNRPLLPGCTGGWEFVPDDRATGSLAIAALQEKIGADPDGKLGPQSIGLLQAHYGVDVDHVLSCPSRTIALMQEALNRGEV